MILAGRAMVAEPGPPNTAGDESRLHPRYQITLVHGTRFFWDRLLKRRAAWTRPDSQFARRLQDHVSGPVDFSEFCWSGGNSQRARAQAARDFVRFIAGSPMDPDTAHFVVAHSHGGNVALMACHSDDVRKRVRGIVCLATPFLMPKPRASSARWLRWMTLAGALVGAGGLFGALLALGWLFRSDVPGWTIPVAMFVLLFLVAGLFGLLEWLADPTLPPDSVLPPTLDVPILAVRTVGDEAAAALVASRLLGQLAEHAWSWPARWIDWLDALPGRVLGRPVTTTALLVPAGMVVGAVLLLLSRISGLEGWWQRFALVYAPLSLLFILPAILFLPAVLFSMLMALPFGWDLALRAAAWDLQVDLDYGETERCRLDEPEDEGLRHTSCVDHPDCAPRIATWMSRLAERPGTGQV